MKGQTRVAVLWTASEDCLNHRYILKKYLLPSDCLS